MDSRILILLLLAAVIVILLILLRRKKENPGAVTETPKKGEGTVCPLCGSVLSGGERVRSVVYPGKPDSIMEISGCPRCSPANPEHPRICPVCRRTLGPEGLVIARYFEKPGRKHVHVLGCDICYAFSTHPSRRSSGSAASSKP